MTWKLVAENIKYRPMRTLLSALLIGVPVTLILTLVGLSAGMREDSARRARGVGADILVRPPGSSLLSLSGAIMPEKMRDALLKEPHVTDATATLVYLIEGFTTVTGVDLESFNRVSGGFKYLEGVPFRNENDILIDDFYARQKKVHAGNTINVLNRDWRVAGVVEAGKLTRIALPLRTLQELLGNTAKVSQIYLKVDHPSNLDTVKETLKAKLEGYPIYSMEEFTSMISVTNISALSAFINVTVGIGVVIGFAVVCLSMYMAVLQRTREIGILKSLGASREYILRIILAEAAILGLSGTLFGIVLSFVARWLILTLVPASLTQAIVLSWWPRVLLISLVGALLGALYPGLRAARQDPIEALAYE